MIEAIRELTANGLEHPLAVPGAERSRIFGCTDLDQLDRWVRRAVSVERAAALLE